MASSKGVNLSPNSDFTLRQSVTKLHDDTNENPTSWLLYEPVLPIEFKTGGQVLIFPHNSMNSRGDVMSSPPSPYIYP